MTKQSRMLAYYKRGIMRLTEHLDAKGEECTTENVVAALLAFIAAILNLAGKR